MYAAASLPRPALGPGERVRVRARTLSRAQNRTLRVRRVGGYQGSTVVTGVQGQKNKGTRTCAVRALVSLCPPRPLLRFPSALLPQAIRQNEGTWPVSCTPEMAGGGGLSSSPRCGCDGPPSILPPRSPRAGRELDTDSITVLSLPRSPVPSRSHACRASFLISRRTQPSFPAFPAQASSVRRLLSEGRRARS